LSDEYSGLAGMLASSWQRLISAGDRERRPGEGLVEARAHAGPLQHIGRAGSEPLGLRIGIAPGRDQAELREPHRLQRARRRPDVSRVRRLAQHDPNILQGIRSHPVQ
jgi:hypothetical protein